MLQERQPVVCHRDGQMRNGVVYSVLKDGLQFLAVVNTSNAVPVSDQEFYLRNVHSTVEMQTHKRLGQ